MAKRILAMLLVMAMVLSVLPAGVFAEGEGQGQQGQPAPQALTAHDDAQHKCEHCDTNVAWELWGDTDDEKTKLPTGSDGNTHYVLVDNIQVAAATYVSSKDITICLNGKQVTTTGNCNTFEMSGTGKVRVTDCTGTGTMTAKSGKVLVMMASGDATAQFDFYAGKITGCTGTTGSVARVQGHCTFNMYGGEISGNSGSSGVVYVQNYGAFKMYAGEAKNNTATNGGAFYLTGNRTKLYTEGGKITGNTATTAGGAIYCAGGTVEIKNTEISGNRAAQSGAIELNANVSGIISTLTLDGAKVTGNNTTTSYGAVYFWNNGGTASVVLKGETKISGNIFGDLKTSTVERNLYMRKHWNYINPAGLSGNAEVYLFVEDGRIGVTDGYQHLTPSAISEDVLKFLYSDKAQYIPGLSSVGRLILVDKPVPPEHPHKICNDAACTEHTADVNFTKWTTNNSLPTSGSIFLDTDVTLSAPVQINGTKLDICLNGHTIKVAANGGSVAAFNIKGAAELNITDCTTDPEKIGKITDATDSVFFVNGGSSAKINLYNGIITGNSGSKAGVAFLQGSSQLNMHGGKITGNTHTALLNAAGTGATRTWGAPVAALYYGTPRFNMYDGEISNNTATAVTYTNAEGKQETKGGNGGVIYSEGTSTQTNLYGGTITNNHADVAGGVFYGVKGSTINLRGTTISVNTADGKAGAVFATGGSKVNVMGGELSQNSAPNGGAILVESSTSVTVSGGKISGNTAKEGAGIYITKNNTFNMTGGEITGNISEGNGGGLSLLCCNSTITGGTITGNTAKYGGGILVRGGELHLNGATITKNTATANGGGIKTGVQTESDGTTIPAKIVMDAGVINENKAGTGGGVIVEGAGCEMLMNGGKITGNTADSGAGLYVSTKCTFDMTGGEISGNTSSKSGAGIYLNNSVGNITGGSITGNTSDYNGGAMFLNGAELTLGSVSITENKAVGAGGIYVNEATKLTITGEPVVQNNTANGKLSNVYLPSKVLFKVDNVGQNAKVGLSAATNFRFVSEANDVDYSKGFTSDRASLQVEYRGQQLYLGASGKHAHCLCDANATGCDHGEILFAAWDDPTSLPTSGNWYLDTDVTLTKAVTEMRNVNLNLCLNGHTIKMTGNNGKIFDVKEATNLSITDCTDKPGTITGANDAVIYGNKNATGKINLYNGVITGNSGRVAGVVFLQTDMVFNMYGGKITENIHYQTENGFGGGAVTAYYGNTQFNMYGGEISGNKSVSSDDTVRGNAGAIYAEGNSVKINLHGGAVSGNHADTAGGAVYAVKGAEINLLGAKLTGNTAGNKSGAIYATGAAKVNMAAGELSGNSAENGGAILVESGAIVNMTGGKISGNKASDGAGIYMTTRTTFDMTGGEISGNIAKGNGGGLALLRCEAAVSGGNISENTAKYGGGMLVRGANLNLKGGQIVKNTATNNGGGIKTGNQNAGKDVYTAKIVMTDGMISENKASSGGGIIIEGAGCEMLMQGGEVSKNTATWGGGMYVSTKTTFAMEGGKIADNVAEKTGGGIQMLNSVTTFTGGEVSGNQCPSTGGGIYVNNEDSVATFDGTTFKNNKGGYGGGACAANRGKIIFKSGSFSNNTAVNNGGGMYISTNSTLDMYGGTITGNNVEKDTGGGLYGLRSTMNLYGGTVSYNKSKIGGGGIMVAAATLNLKGANVLYNTALSDSGKGGTGGGVRTNCQTVTKNGVKTEYKAKINMTAGTIKGNECGYGGGGVLVNGAGASMTMSGGSICDNISRDLGGGLYVSNKTTFTMTGGEVCRNEASGDGGGFWLAKNTTHSMANAKIYENTAGKKAGGVYFHNNTTCTFTDVQFSKNISTNGGAIFGQQDMNPIMIRCTFTENESTEYSGGAVFSRYKATIQDCKFVGNKSAGSGGAVYVGQSSLSVNGWGNSKREDAGAYITGTTFENNTAAAMGGALHIIMSASTEIKNSTFTGNSAGEAGTAIWTEEDLTMEDVTVTGNKGTDGVYAVYLAASEYDGESYFKGLMKMGGDMVIRDNEGGDLYLAEKTTVTVLESGFGEKTHIGVTLDSGVLTQRVYGAYNYEGGDCVYTITYGDRSLTDPEIDASLLAAAEGDPASVQDILLYTGVGVFVLAIAAVVVVILARKKKNTAKEAVEK